MFELETLQGINLNKVDKGCLIYNTNKEQGYLMSIIDGTSRAETSYWMDDFLQVRQRQDEYFETQETLNLYKEYITKQLPQEFEITKAVLPIFWTGFLTILVVQKSLKRK